MTKANIRSLQKDLRNHLSQEEQQRLSYEIRERLFETEAFRSCENLLIFVSFEVEVDTHEIITQAIQKGKRVYIPRVEAREMEFYEIHDLQHLITSKFGILEPVKSEATKFRAVQNTIEVYKNLMLLPGLAFDLGGNRIGYGAGYYDKYISSYSEKTFYRMALAYDFQIMNLIPAEDYDKKVDEIITPTTIYQCNDSYNASRFI